MVITYPKVTGVYTTGLPAFADLTELTAYVPDYDGYAAVVKDTDKIYIYNLSLPGWVLASGTSANSFAFVQGDSGTTPAASSATDTLTLTTNASSVASFVGNSATDTLSLNFAYTPENVANKDTTTTLGTSDTKYPSQKAVKTYVDALGSSTPTASTVAKWDANANISATNLIAGFATTATSGGTTTLTITSKEQQYFSGSSNQTCVLPVAATLIAGMSYQIVNLSSGVVTVQTSGSNVLQAMAASTILTATVIDTAGGTGTASWSWTYSLITSVPKVTSQSGNYTAVIGDFVKGDANSAAFTVTLPTAVGQTGKSITVQKIDSSFNVITINTTSSQTMNGGASGSKHCSTQFETIVFVSDGSNWLIQSRSYPSPISGVTLTTSAGFGTVTNTSFIARRMGGSLHLDGRWTNGTVAGSVASAALPSGIAINTSNLSSNASGFPIGHWYGVASAATNILSLNFSGAVIYDGSTSGTVFFSASYLSGAYVKSNGSVVGVSSSAFPFYFDIPVANWDE